MGTCVLLLRERVSGKIDRLCLRKHRRSNRTELSLDTCEDHRGWLSVVLASIMRPGHACVFKCSEPPKLGLFLSMHRGLWLKKHLTHLFAWLCASIPQHRLFTSPHSLRLLPEKQNCSSEGRIACLTPPR